MQFIKSFSEKTILLDLNGAKKEDALKSLAESLVVAKMVAKKEGAKVLELVKKREKLGSTGIGWGVAIPHVKVPGLKATCAAFGLHREGIDYKSVDGEAVKIIFFIASPEGEDESHLAFLQWVSRLGRNPDFRMFAARATDPSEILSLFQEMASP